MSKILKSSIGFKCDTWRLAEKRLSGEERNRIRDVLTIIQLIQVEISRIMIDFDFQRKCNLGCENFCCTADVPNDLIKPADLCIMLFEESQKEKDKIIAAIEKCDKSQDDCCFLDPEIGCIISEFRRPMVCKTFFCQKEIAQEAAFFINGLRVKYREIATILAGEWRRKN